MIHDLRSLQTYPPPKLINEVQFLTEDEITVLETIEDWEGHRKPFFYVVATHGKKLQVRVVFTVPFKTDEEWLLKHLKQVIDEKLIGEEEMGHNV